MPLTFDPSGRFKKPNKNNPASKIRQPGTINDGLKSARREQGNKGALSTQQGKANYGGEVQPQKMGDRPFDPPDAYSKEMQRASGALREGANKYAPLINTFTGMNQLGAAKDYVKDIYNKGFFNATGRAVSDAGDLAAEGAGMVGDVVRGVGRDVAGAGTAFSAGLEGQDTPIFQAPDDDFTAYDEQFGNLPGAFNREVSTPESSPEVAGSSLANVLGAPGVTKQTYDREDGTQGTLYSNTVQPDEAVGADGYTASGRFMGVNPGESDYDRNTAGLSQINRDISNLLTDPAQVAANDRGLDELLAYNENKKVAKRANSQRNSLRTMLKRGQISGRRYTDALAKIGAEQQASNNAQLDSRELGLKDRIAQSEQLRAQALNTQAGSKADATRYAADIGRQNELDKIAATSQDTLREGAFSQAESRNKLLSEFVKTPEGLELLKANPSLFAEIVGGGVQDERAAYEALKNKG
jgi:hypothetical protein